MFLQLSAPPAGGGSKGVSSGGRLTAARATFIAAVQLVTPEEARRVALKGRVAESTLRTYRLGLPLYEESCAAAGCPIWPPTERGPEVFAGYLKQSEYTTPWV